jgi:hypothetical protein
VPVAERRERLLSIFGNVAELGAERMEELAPHATLRDAGIAAGIATDRLLTLLGDGGGVPANQYASQRSGVTRTFRAMDCCFAEGSGSAENKESLPNGETLSEPPSAMDLHSGEENLQD